MLHNAHKVVIYIGNENSNLPLIIIHTYHDSVPKLATNYKARSHWQLPIKHESERLMTQMECSFHVFFNFQACMEGFDYIDFARFS